MPRNWIEAKVITIIDESPTVKRFILHVESEEIFTFTPGQFVTFDLPVGDKRLDRWRSYSIASTPSGDNMFELCIVLLDDGKGSGYFFTKVFVGTILKFKGPDGSFVLPPETEPLYVLVCTGTGVAPFRSMIKHAYEHGLPYRFHLIFGCRTKEDILYFEEFQKISEEQPLTLRYDVVLSRETSDAFYHGYVHQVYEKAYTSENSTVVFFLCGWSKMIDEARNNLIETMGFRESQVLFELYG
ncbi:MAG: FAD-binding oxidoreductase [Saprospiraceae bacterium]